MKKSELRQLIKEEIQLLTEQSKKEYTLTLKSNDSKIKEFLKDIQSYQKKYISPGMIPLLIKALKAGIVTIDVGQTLWFDSGKKYRYFYFNFKNGVYDPEDIIVMKNNLEKALSQLK